MKKCVFPVFCVCMLTLLVSCGYYGNGDVVSQERSAQGFDKIVLTGTGNIHIYPDNEFRVVVTTDSNLQQYFNTDVNGKYLYLKQKSNINFDPTRLNIDIYLPELESISMEGAGNIKIYNGSAVNLDIKVSGTGNIDTSNYEVENVYVDVSGTGTIKIWATNSVSGSISGVGNVRYKGNPSMGNLDISGVGTFKPL